MNKVPKEILNRMLLASAGLIFTIVLVIFSESLGLPTEFYINCIKNNFIISILLFGAFLVSVLWLLGIHLNYNYNKYLKGLSPEKRKREKENYKIASAIIKYTCEKYGNNHNLEIVNVTDEKDSYSMIYRKPKSPQKIKISFNRKSKMIEESLH